METLQFIQLALVGSVGLAGAGPVWGVAEGSDQTLPGSASGVDVNPIGVLPAGTANVASSGGSANPPSTSSGRAPVREWTFSTGADASVTLTNNVALAPPGQEQADAVLALSVPLGLHREGPRVKLQADYIPTVYLYAKNSDSDYVENNLRAFMSVEAVDDYFFVDASANILPSYISPFVARPESGASITPNRTQQTTLGLSPYIRHGSDTDWNYVIRNDNYWNIYNTAGLSNGVTNGLSADLVSPAARVRYGFDYAYLHNSFETPPTSYNQEVGRVRPIVTVTPRLNVSARLGYETNDYSPTNRSGPVYGAGARWTPTPRTTLDGFIEHRFFGPSYRLDLNHRTRMTSWRLSGTRNVYTAQDQGLTLVPPTMAEVLNDTFRSQIPDAAERDRAVQQFMQQAGLPQALTQPYSFYTNVPYISQQWSGSVGLLGRRNSFELSFLWQENQPATSTSGPQPGGIVAYSQLRQQGFTANFTHRLSALSAITLTGNRLYSLAAAAPATPATGSTQNTLTLNLTRQLSPKTNASIGVRGINGQSGTSPYRERAVLAGVSHRF